MGIMWLDNSADDRAKRLLVKFGASPFLPALAVSKALEAAIADGELVTWTMVSVASFVWFLIAEDLHEYAQQQYDCLQDALEDL
jgi:hypothetical protein